MCSGRLPVCLLGDTLVEGTAGRDNPVARMVASDGYVVGGQRGSQTMADFPPARNRLLAALRSADPAAEAQLREGLESVELALHDEVMGPDRPIEHVYFPETGVLSQIQQMRNGSAVEVNLVGSDGMAGLAVYLGGGLFGAGHVPADAVGRFRGGGRSQSAVAQGSTRLHAGRSRDSCAGNRLRSVPPC